MALERSFAYIISLIPTTILWIFTDRKWRHRDITFILPRSHSFWEAQMVSNRTYADFQNSINILPPSLALFINVNLHNVHLN